MRKRLPPLFSLQVFECAARHGKFTLAAEELHLTQGAISRQIKQLEDWCGLSLFTRHGPRVALTSDGQALLDRLNAPLNALHAAFDDDNQTRPQKLHIATLVSVAQTLLLPHLPRFSAQHPEIQISLQTDYALTTFPPQLALVALRFMNTQAQEIAGVRQELLFGDRLVAVAAPSVAKELGSSPEKWPAHRLLRQTNMDWSHWHEGQTWSKDFYAEGMEFNDASVLLTAARHGTGIALARLSVAWEKLHRGELVLAAPLCVHSFSSHFLMVREDTASLPAVAAFTKWIRHEAQLWQERLAFFDQHSSTKI